MQGESWNCLASRRQGSGGNLINGYKYLIGSEGGQGGVKKMDPHSSLRYSVRKQAIGTILNVGNSIKTEGKDF